MDENKSIKIKDTEAIEKSASTHYNEAEYDKAIYWKEIVYAYYRNNYSEYAPETLKALYNLGRYYRKANLYKYALNVYHVLYNVCVKNYGEVHNGTLLSLNVLVNCYLDLGFNKTVFKLYKKAYEACLKILGEEHLDTIQTLENYAYGCYYVGDYNQALELTKKLSSVEGREEDSLKLFASIYIKSGEFEKADEIIAELESKYKPKETKPSKQKEKIEVAKTIEEDDWFFNEHETSFYLTFLSTIYQNVNDKEKSNQAKQDIVDVVDEDLIYYILTETDALISRFIEEIKQKDYLNINKLNDFIIFLEKVADLVTRYKPVKKYTIRSSMALYIIKIMELKEAINMCDYQFSIDKDAFLTDEEQKGTYKLSILANKIATQSFKENGYSFTAKDIFLLKNCQESSFPRAKARRIKKDQRNQIKD